MNLPLARNLIDKFKAPDQKLKFYLEKKIKDFNPVDHYSEYSDQSEDNDLYDYN